jgi:FKBP-type peptidyl-prolyl cis-trans isomerase
VQDTTRPRFRRDSLRALGPLALLGALTCACSPAPKGSDAFEAPALHKETRARGLEIETIVEGSGPPAEEGDYASFHYAVRLENGTQVGGNRDRKPDGLLIGKDDESIEGLQLGLIGMRQHELRRIHVPHALAYRDRSINNGQIPPRSNLVFEVELMVLSPN